MQIRPNSRNDMRTKRELYSVSADAVVMKPCRAAVLRLRANPASAATTCCGCCHRRTASARWRRHAPTRRRHLASNVGTFAWITTLLCALQFPLRLAPELVFASFGFARLLPQFERAFPYLLFCRLNHNEFSQSAGPALGRRHRGGPSGRFYS